VHHLDVVTGTLVTNPLAAGLTVRLGRDGLEDVLDVRPGLLVTTRHDAGTVSGTFLSAGDTSSDKADALLGKVLCSAVGVGVVRVSTIDDDVALFYATLVKEELDEVVDGLASHDEHHHAAGLLELRDEVLDGVGAHDGLALGLCGALAVARVARLVIIVPSAKKRSTLATLSSWLASFSSTGLGFPYVRLNATTYRSLLANEARARGWKPYGESVISAVQC
jgi:hypothetical protein